MILSIILKWNYKQINFIMAFPQADIKNDMYMSLPAGIVPTDSSKDYISLLRNNLYGQKQAGRVFYLYLKKISTI